MEDFINLFKSIYLFNSFTDDEIKLLRPIVKVENFPGYHYIFHAGENPKALYLIKKGTVRISLPDHHGEEIEVQDLASGAHFGEVAFLDPAKRSANAETLENSEIITLEFQELRKFLEQHPMIALKFYQQMSGFLAKRLRRTSQDLVRVRAINMRHF